MILENGLCEECSENTVVSTDKKSCENEKCRDNEMVLSDG